jgi:hypothetical protein
MVCSSSMNCPSADGMSSKCYASQSRRVSQEYNLPHVLDLTALAVLVEFVARVQTATGSS